MTLDCSVKRFYFKVVIPLQINTFLHLILQYVCVILMKCYNLMVQYYTDVSLECIDFDSVKPYEHTRVYISWLLYT